MSERAEEEILHDSGVVKELLKSVAASAPFFRARYASPRIYAGYIVPRWERANRMAVKIRKCRNILAKFLFTSRVVHFPTRLASISISEERGRNLTSRNFSFLRSVTENFGR